MDSSWLSGDAVLEVVDEAVDCRTLGGFIPPASTGGFQRVRSRAGMGDGEVLRREALPAGGRVAAAGALGRAHVGARVDRGYDRERIGGDDSGVHRAARGDRRHLPGCERLRVAMIPPWGGRLEAGFSRAGAWPRPAPIPTRRPGPDPQPCRPDPIPDPVPRGLPPGSGLAAGRGRAARGGLGGGDRREQPAVENAAWAA